MLAPGIDACKYRNATRNPEDHFEFDRYECLDADMRRGFGDTGWWFGTSRLTPEETAERLVVEAADRTSPIARRAGTHG